MRQKLKILFVTDIHLSFENVEKLFKWHNEHQINFDLILIGGDTANCDQNNNTHDEEFEEKEATLILTSIQERFGCKLYFIPGNHDPLTYYNESHFIKNNIISCHEKTMKIAEGLEIVGFGGSVPGYGDKERKDEIWKGYPFNSNEALAEHLLNKSIFPAQDLEPENQLIYLTHCGSFDCETSIDRKKLDSIIYGGATEYNSFVKHKNLILHLHGHVHNGSKFAKYFLFLLKNLKIAHNKPRTSVIRLVWLHRAQEKLGYKEVGVRVKSLCKTVKIITMEINNDDIQFKFISKIFE